MEVGDYYDEREDFLFRWIESRKVKLYFDTKLSAFWINC